MPEPVREKLDSEESESVVSRTRSDENTQLEYFLIRILKIVFLFQLAAAEKWHEALRAAVGTRALSPLVLDTQVFDLTLCRVLCERLLPGSLCADAPLLETPRPTSNHHQQAGAGATTSRGRCLVCARELIFEKFKPGLSPSYLTLPPTLSSLDWETFGQRASSSCG